MTMHNQAGSLPPGDRETLKDYVQHTALAAPRAQEKEEPAKVTNWRIKTAPDGNAALVCDACHHEVSQATRWCQCPIEAPRPEPPSGEMAALIEKIEAIQQAATTYLSILNRDQPLGDEFKTIKGRIVTLACNLRPFNVAALLAGPQSEETKP